MCGYEAIAGVCHIIILVEVAWVEPKFINSYFGKKQEDYITSYKESDEMVAETDICLVGAE